jgi:hypothetical protein
MAKSWSRYFIKLKLIFLAVIILTLAFNIAIGLFASRFIESANKKFFKPVTVGWIYYLPPNFIFLNNLSIHEKNNPPDEEIITLQTVRLNLSLWRLITERRTHILSINCLRTAAQHYNFMRFIGKNIDQILEFFRSLPLQDIQLSVRNASFLLPENNGRQDKLELDLTLKLTGQTLSAYGSSKKKIIIVDQNNPPKPARVMKTSLLRYEFMGSLTPYGIAVKKMELNGEGLRCELWGETNKSVSEIKGFIFANTNLKEKLFEDSGSTEGLRSLYSDIRNKFTPKTLGLPGANLFIFNLDTRIDFSYPEILVERLNFSINANPMELKGKAHITEPFSFNFNLHSKFRCLENVKKSGLKDVSLTLYANSKDKRLVANGSLNIDSLEDNNNSLPWKKIELIFTGFGLSLEEYLLKTHTETISLFCKTDANDYRITLDNLDTENNITKNWPKMLKFSSRFYGGSLDGEASIMLKKFTPVIKAELNVENADTNRLDGILKHFSKVYGRISSQMHFINAPQMALEGKMRIENGYLKDFEFFKWLAEMFVLPSLKRVDFKDASSDFLASESGAELRNMRLDSEDVKLEGYFKLGAGDLTSSKISLLFSYALLSQSPKFAPLLRVLQKELNLIAFDFQLAGSLRRMNFKWLKSDFKDKVQKAIPNFIERRIERDIEEFIKGLEQGS